LDRILNYLFILALIGVFVLDACAAEHNRMIVGALFAGGFCILAFVMNWLSLDGARAGTVIGTLIFGLGGFPATFLVLFFFLSSTFISKKDTNSDHSPPAGSLGEVRRDGLQVWCNGFWYSVFLLLGFVLEADIFWVAAVSALATATADTWATELGSRRFNTQTWLLQGFKKVEAGTEGGVSLPGTIAAVVGSAFISLFAVYLFSLKISSFFIILTSGVLGCLADSYFGGAFQGTKRVIRLSIFYGELKRPIDNNMVNWMSTGVGSSIAIILTLVF
jgi:uncharacterized protein (TIGR00297 family)